MRKLRNWVPVLGILALVALFLKLPETPNLFGIFKCKTCVSDDPYLALIGSGYFAILVAVSILFPAFPGRYLARGGLIWAILLALSLTYILLPGWCAACLISHACNILIWVIWVVVPPRVNDAPTATVRERLCLTLFAPISVVALFSCLNLTFMAYNFKSTQHISGTSLQAGEKVPAFTVQTTEEGRLAADTDVAHVARMVINFVSPNCPYCKEQLPILNAVAAQLAGGPYRFINVSPAVPPELVQESPGAEWVEDREGTLRELFKVSGYPTLFILGNDGKIVKVISGVPDDLKTFLLTTLRL